MDVSKLKKIKLPITPGVYFFLGKRKEILYIGKATSLKARVRSYFDMDIKDKRSALIEKLVTETKSIEWSVTDSVLEAMLLEVNLIRTHKPNYNTISKDDKSYNNVVITKDEFPRVLVVRGKDLQGADVTEKYAYIYGPYPSGTLFKDALKIIRKLFQFYDTAKPVGYEKSKMLKGKIDFNRQIGLYPNSCTKAEYAQTIKHIQLFFEGKKTQIIKDLEKHMHILAKKEKFEQAQIIKKKIFALQHIQDVSLIKDESRIYKDEKTMRVEAYDVAHISGKSMVGAMTVIEAGIPNVSAYRKFIIKGFDGSNDPRALAEILTRRFQHPEWPFPDLIVVDGSTAQKNSALQVLKKYDKHIPVVGVVKDERHNPKRIIGAAKLITEHKHIILLANAEAHRFAITFHRQHRAKRFLPAS